jgi:cysteine desulfurase family protein
MSSRIYLDNAATSWPKPDAVYEAVDRYHRCNGAPYGRGTNREADEVARTVRTCRARIAQLIDAREPTSVVYTYSGTDSLNLALHGVLRSGDHVITTMAEHNSVLRPLRFLEETLGIEATRVRVDSSGRADPDEVRRQIRKETRLISVIHASNVTGCLQPVEEIGRLAREHDLLFLVDAAQSLGHVEVSVDRLQCDLLAAPGHKGLFGPTGTGVLYVGPRAGSILRPLRQGGTGSNSESDLQPDTWPDRFEAGNHNVPGLWGLAAGVEYILSRTVADIQRHEHELTALLLSRLSAIAGLRIVGGDSAEGRVGVVSLQMDDYSPQELAGVLDSLPVRVQGRAGFHCAPTIHRAIGSADSGGTFRLSVSALVTAEQIEEASSILASVMV